jgi:hypothetical protein
VHAKAAASKTLFNQYVNVKIDTPTGISQFTGVTIVNDFYFIGKAKSPTTTFNVKYEVTLTDKAKAAGCVLVAPVPAADTEENMTGGLVTSYTVERKVKGEKKIEGNIYFLPVEIKVNDTAKEEDDFVAVSKGTDDDLATDFSVKITGTDGVTAELKVKPVTPVDGAIKFKKSTLALVDGVETKTKLWGITPSSAKDKTIIEITLKKGYKKLGVLEEDVTVFEGVDLRFEGTYYANVDVRDYKRRPWDGRVDPKPNSKYDPVLTSPPGSAGGAPAPYKVGMIGLQVIASILESNAFDYTSERPSGMSEVEYKNAVDQDMLFGYQSAISLDSDGKDNKDVPSYRPWSPKAEVKIIEVMTKKPSGVKMDFDPLKNQKVKMIKGKFSNIGNDGKTFVNDQSDMVRLPHIEIGDYLILKNTDLLKDTGIKSAGAAIKFSSRTAPTPAPVITSAHRVSHGPLLKFLEKRATDWPLEKTWVNKDLKINLGAKKDSLAAKCLVDEGGIGGIYSTTLTFMNIREISLTGRIVDGRIYR